MKSELLQTRVDYWAKYMAAGGPERIYSALKAQLRQMVLGEFGGFHKFVIPLDFLQDFCVEALRKFRSECNLPRHSPRSACEVAELAAYTERYARRRVGGKVLLTLRFLRSLNREALIEKREPLVDFGEVFSLEGDEDCDYSIYRAVREVSAREKDDRSPLVPLLDSLYNYLGKHPDCQIYLALRWQDRTAPEIDRIMDLTQRERDLLQQKFRFHLDKWGASEGADLYNEYFGLSPSNGYGLGKGRWEELANTSPRVAAGKTKGEESRFIAWDLECTIGQVDRAWRDMMLAAKKDRSEVAK